MSTYLEDILHFYGWLEDHPLSVGAVALYGYLLNLRNKERQRLYASGSIIESPNVIIARNKEIQKALNISRHETLTKYIEELIGSGLIMYRQGLGCYTSTYYFNHYG